LTVSSVPYDTNRIKCVMQFQQGRFSVQLPAGKYRLDVAVPGRGQEPERNIPIEDAILLEEGSHRTLRIQ
jgi:hypothetical protein